MNLIISSVVAALGSTALVFGGVQAYQSSTDQDPVSQDQLYTYSSR
jgi:hypothetical protein